MQFSYCFVWWFLSSIMTIFLRRWNWLVCFFCMYVKVCLLFLLVSLVGYALWLWRFLDIFYNICLFILIICLLVSLFVLSSMATASISLITKTRVFKYIENFTSKNWKFSDKNSDIFHISAQIIDFGYSLEPPWRGGSNEYPQSMFLSRNNVYPCKLQFYCIKVGFKGVKIIWACFRDVR